MRAKTKTGYDTDLLGSKRQFAEIDSPEALSRLSEFNEWDAKNGYVRRETSDEEFLAEILAIRKAKQEKR